MKVLGLIEQDLDVVSKKYVDDKIASIPTGGGESEAVKGKVMVNVPSLYFGLMWAAKNLDEPINNFKRLVYTIIFNKDSYDKNGTSLKVKYQEFAGNIEIVDEIFKNDPNIYINYEKFNDLIDEMTTSFDKTPGIRVLTQTEYAEGTHYDGMLYFIKED